MRDPGVASISVVFDNDEAAARDEVPGKGGDDLDLLLASDEMEAIRCDKTVEWGQGERPLEVGDDDVDHDCRKPRPDCLGVPFERPLVAIHHDDPPTGTEQGRERQGEGALAGADVGPRPARGHGRPKQRDVIGVVHGP